MKIIRADYQAKQLQGGTDSDVYENLRLLNQDLTFDSAANAFKRYDVKFTKEKYRVLGIADGSGELYTNLGLLLSDQCQHTTKTAVFADTAITVFRDSREFGGSVLAQFEQAVTYDTTGIAKRKTKRRFPDMRAVRHRIAS